MEHVRLPSTTQHKRKASASEFLQDCDPKTARSREAEGLGLEHGQPQQDTDDGDKEEPQALILTETSSMHLTQLRQSQEELVAKIDEITGGRGRLAALGWFLMGKSAAVMEQSVASLVLHHKIREKVFCAFVRLEKAQHPVFCCASTPASWFALHRRGGAGPA
jgi:hypothetical protein